MEARSIVARAAVAALLWFGFAPLPAASEPPAAAGESWEVTSRMSMKGMPMPMPSQTNRMCSKPDEVPAENPDPNCRNGEYVRTGSKVTWTVQCTGPHAMSGRGEITYSGEDAYTGSIRFESAEGVTLIELSGKRVGSCQLRS